MYVQPVADGELCHVVLMIAHSQPVDSHTWRLGLVVLFRHRDANVPPDGGDATRLVLLLVHRDVNSVDRGTRLWPDRNPYYV